MPFIDFNNSDSIPQIVERKFDYTIVGAGAAGILLAVKLSKKGKQVLLIESGNFNIDEQIQKLNEVEQQGKKMGGITWGRKRAVGGSTLAWGGQSLPFSPFDFEQKDWVHNSGWPLSYEELSAHYNEANRFMKIYNYDYENDPIFQKIGLKKRPNFNADKLKYHVSKWAKQPDFNKMYGSFLKKKVTVLFHATLEHIYQDNNQKIKSISILNHNAEKFIHNIKNLIITAGGTETNRILLHNKHIIKNEASLQHLGKGFMDHPCIEIGEIKTKNPYLLQKFFNTHNYSGNKVSVRLSLSEKQQRSHKLLNCSASLFFIFPENFENPYSLLKDIIKDLKFRNSLKLVAHSKHLLVSLYALLKDKFYYKINAQAKVLLMIEQEAIENSYISLSEKTDYLGHALAKVNWDISALTWQTAIKMTSLIRSEFKRLNLGDLEHRPEVFLENQNWKQLLTDVNHHMGGTRMSLNRETGIVDGDLKLWDVDNLYICSCSVFPTSSHSNPTLTLLALASRLSHHLL